MVEPGSTIAGSNEVDECSDTRCCLLTQASASDLGAKCECLQTSASCDAEAAARAGSKVVSQCPPPGEAPSDAIACIAEGQSCSWSAEGDCCGGARCAPNAAGVQVCQTASTEELALAKECTRVAKSDDIEKFDPPVGELRTSVGNVAIPAVEHAFAGVGPNGCLNKLQLTLGDYSTCGLDFTVALKGGQFVVTHFGGTLDDCEGYTGDPKEIFGGTINESNSGVELSFQGLACDGDLIFESYCVAGTFDFHIPALTPSHMTIEEQHVIVSGTTCSYEPDGACPSP